MSRSETETAAIVRPVAARLTAGALVCVRGPMGSGKSVCARAIGAGLGIVDRMPSPTFQIAREYAGRVPVLHVDLFRLGSAEEFDSLGLDDQMAQSVTIVEWPERSPRLLAEADLVITMELTDSSVGRRITIEDRTAR